MGKVFSIKIKSMWLNSPWSLKALDSMSYMNGLSYQEIFKFTKPLPQENLWQEVMQQTSEELGFYIMGNISSNNVF